MKPKSLKISKRSVKARIQKKVIRRNIAPWDRPKVILPYGPELFTMDQLNAAIKKVGT